MSSDLPSKIGIIAGGGRMPILLAEECARRNIEVFGVGFEDHTDSDFFELCPNITSKLGQVGTIIKAFQKRDVQDLVLIGSIKRPSFSELIPDLKATKFLAKNGLKAQGDSGLLSALREFLEGEGFRIHGIQDFIPDLVISEGVLTKTKPNKQDRADIERGIEVLQGMAAIDIGQAVIVQDGLVLGVEAIEGTSALIERCAPLKRKGAKGVLLKLCKPQQDVMLDLPTIGIETLKRIHEAGFGGIAAHAGKSLIVDQEELVSYANQHHLYMVGVNPN